MKRIAATLIAAVAVVAAALLTAPAPGAVRAASGVVNVDPVRLPAACPGPLEVPVGDIQSGDEDLDSGSDDVDWETVPQGESLGEAVAIDAPVAASVERVGSGDIAGLAGLGCAPPAQEQWLIGASTALGSSARLVLANPSDTSVRAQVELFGPVGPIGVATTVIVGPRSQESLLLEGVEAEVPSIAVRVSAGGVGVAAAIQDSRLTGFIAAGTDWISPSEPAMRLSVPYAGPSSEQAPTSLALLAPDGAEVSLRSTTAAGDQPWLGSSTITLEPGVVTEVAVPQGDVSAIEVDASAPVVAGASVRVARPAAVGDGSAHDLAWTAGQNRDDTRPRAAVVPSGNVALVVQSGREGTFTLETGGAPLGVPVRRDTVDVIPLDLPAGTVLTSAERVSWVLLVTDPDSGFVTTIDPVPTDLEPREVTVRLGSYVSAP